MPKAYSYIRFSSKAQEKGDSLRRQKQLAIDYCKVHGLELESKSYIDLGLSAFKSENAKMGELSAFIAGVATKAIPRDSWLLVESLDRLSRDAIEEAIGLFLQIKSMGVTIVSLQDGKVYKGGGEGNDNNTMDLMMAMLVFMRANNESLTKSKRVKAAWDNKRASGKIMTKMCPSWLKHNGKGWDIIEEEADKIRLMFKLADQGYGGLLIAQHLNDNNILTPTGKQWIISNVIQRLRNKSAIGILDHRSSTLPPVLNYYPPIVSEELFYKINSLIDRRHQTRAAGRKTNVVNLFSGKIKCSICGAPVRIVGSQRGENYYYRCGTAYQSKALCDAKAIPLKLLEPTLLATMFVTLAFVDDHQGGYNDNAAIEKDIEDNNESISMFYRLAEKKRLDEVTLMQNVEKLEQANKDLRARLVHHPVTTMSAAYSRARMAYTALQCIISGQLVDDKLSVRKALKDDISRLVDTVYIGGHDITDDRGKYRLGVLSGPVLEICGKDVESIDVRIGEVDYPDWTIGLDITPVLDKIKKEREEREKLELEKNQK